jgi:alkylation response protein AidB-like acyl-CoA dehydrogenase
VEAGIKTEADGAFAPELAEALLVIAAGAEALDREPRFPSEAFARLAAEGVLGFSLPDADGTRPAVAGEWALVRAVARADSSVGRILDGHLNAVERISLLSSGEVRDGELDAVSRGERLLGLWGADPVAGEGEPAQLVEREGAVVLDGAKTFCSGAGGVDAALVLARTPSGGPPSLVLVACDDTVEIDRSWFRPGGLRSSESHLVRFCSTPVIEVLGEPGELSRDPWFSLDAIRTAASWAGMADAAAEAALSELAGNPKRREEQIACLAAGRIAASRSSIDAWFSRAAGELERGGDVSALSIELRIEVDRAARAILDEAARACGSRPFARGGRLDRARRDLELFTLQHRLEPILARRGNALLESGR